MMMTEYMLGYGILLMFWKWNEEVLGSEEGWHNQKRNMMRNLYVNRDDNEV